MRVSGFMVPAEKVVTALRSHSVLEVMDLMLLHSVGCVVIVNMQANELEQCSSTMEIDVDSNNDCDKDGTTMIPMAMGIITKSDLLRAYRNRVNIDAPCQTVMGDRRLVSCHPGDDRDTVARILEEHHTHHVIVVDEARAHFLGVVSSWDVAAECAKDGQVWPYLRGEDGSIVLPKTRIAEGEVAVASPPYDPTKATTIFHHNHEKTATYMDDLDLEAFQ